MLKVLKGEVVRSVWGFEGGVDRGGYVFLRIINIEWLRVAEER